MKLTIIQKWLELVTMYAGTNIGILVIPARIIDLITYSELKGCMLAAFGLLLTSYALGKLNNHN